MNINFHYFAVKSLACLAGFPDAEAQQIAKYSQFVDDYNPPLVMTCSNIPDVIKSSDKLDLYSPTLVGNFRPVSTGFTNPFEYATLIVPREQRFILSPFHFMPFHESLAGQAGARVVPLSYGDNSLIDRLLQIEVARYGTGADAKITLLRLGLLFHIFADTHAHQMFTGFVSNANRVSITEVHDNITGKNITGEAHTRIRSLFKNAISHIPAIGHVQAGHNPDLSHVSFTCSRDADNISRNNTEVFIEAARNMYRYLAKCRGNDSAPGIELNSESERKLRHGFLIEMPRRHTMHTLAAHWKQVFPDIDYHYSSGEIRQGFGHSSPSVAAMAWSQQTVFSDEFYAYSVMANEVLVALYGPRPR